MKKITITRPDDWHLHLRDKQILKVVAVHSADRFSKAVIMPNLKPPVTTVARAIEYRAEILAVLPSDTNFQPYMALYLTDSTPIQEVKEASINSEIIGFKLYPAGATTHSEAGVTNVDKIFPLLEAMERFDVPLLVHGEVTDATVDIFDREVVFIDKYLTRIVKTFSALRVVLEHVTTRTGVQFVQASSDKVAGTITAHHLLYNRNHLLAGAIRPHYYCLPVLKREADRQALLEAATGDDRKFFLGTDSAPHFKSSKESGCGCAGCYTAHAAIELYTEAFESHECLDKLEQFASFNGADFYCLPRNTNLLTLVKSDWPVAEAYSVGSESIIPLRAGECVRWKVGVE